MPARQPDAAACPAIIARVKTACAAITAVLVAAALSACASQSARPDGKRELEAYLGKVLIEQRGYENTRAQALAALDHASAVAPDRTWREAAGQLALTEREYQRLVGRMVAIKPPPALKAEHAGMIRSLRLYQALVANLERPLRNRDVVAMSHTLGTTTKLGIRANELRIRWRQAAYARAVHLGIEFPNTLDHVGRSLAQASLES